MPIIIEGPDGAGKTTLIQRLQKEFPTLTLVSRHVNHQGPTTDLKLWVEQDHPSQLRDFPRIYDRHPLISEPIYGPILRGNLAEGFNDLDWFMEQWAWLTGASPIFIFCLPPLEVVQSRLSSTPQMPGVDNSIGLIYWSYHALAARMAVEQWSTLIYDYTIHNLEAYLGFIKEHM